MTKKITMTMTKKQAHKSYDFLSGVLMAAEEAKAPRSEINILYLLLDKLWEGITK